LELLLSELFGVVFQRLTTAGVFRFDGLRFESTDEVTNREIHNADIVTVFPSPSGGVWLTTRSHGLLLWKDTRVTNYPDRRCTPAQGLNGIVEDRDGSLWIAGSAGLFDLLIRHDKEVGWQSTLQQNYFSSVRIA
jgi:ligand-binding sensor domain-containing protein